MPWSNFVSNTQSLNSDFSAKQGNNVFTALINLLNRMAAISKGVYIKSDITTAVWKTQIEILKGDKLTKVLDIKQEEHEKGSIKVKAYVTIHDNIMARVSFLTVVCLLCVWLVCICSR